MEICQKATQAWMYIGVGFIIIVSEHHHTPTDIHNIHLNDVLTT